MKYLIVWNSEIRPGATVYKKVDNWEEAKRLIAEILNYPGCIYYAGPIWKTNAVV